MTIRELIKKLEKMPEDTEVLNYRLDLKIETIGCKLQIRLDLQNQNELKSFQGMPRL